MEIPIRGVRLRPLATLGSMIFIRIGGIIAQKGHIGQAVFRMILQTILWHSLGELRYN